MADLISAPPLTEAELAKLCRGYLTLGVAIILNVIGTVARFGPHVIPVMVVGGVGMFGSLILSVIALFQVARGMKLSPTMLAFTCMLILIPFASFVVLLVLRIKTSETLRQEGYMIRLLSAARS